MPTWETDADWDGAVDESGVVHESVGNTDHNDATIVKQGYQIANPYLSSSLKFYLPLHETSSSTAYDFSGNNNDWSVNGASQGATGPLGTSGYSFDNTDDYLLHGSIGGLSDTDNFTFTAWFKPENTGHSNIFHPRAEQDFRMDWDRFGNQELAVAGYTDHLETGSANTSLSTGTYYHIGYVWTSGSVEFYLNGQSDGTASISWQTLSNNESYIGYVAGRNEYPLGGDLSDLRLYDYALSQAEIEYLYNVVATSGSLTTDKRTL